MKRLIYSHRNLLIGDEAADVLISYAAMLVGRGDADVVRFTAISGDGYGDEVAVTALLASGAPLMAETSRNDCAEPDNANVVEYMRERLLRRGASLPVLAVDAPMALSMALDGDPDLGGLLREEPFAFPV